MKIDYELVEKIGATHYSTIKQVQLLFKQSGNILYEYYCGADKLEEWRISGAKSGWVLSHTKPIPPKPQVRVEYEKVEFENASSAVYEFEEFHNGNEAERLFIYADGKYAEPDIYQVVGNYENLYRRIEKPVDWRDVTSKWVQKNQSVNIEFLSNAVMYYHGSVSNDNFLEMCRVALRANGEL